MSSQSFKDQVIDQIIASVEADIQLATKSAKTAHIEATHDESKAEDPYDTRGLEASYLAQAQAARALDLKPTLLLFKNLKGTIHRSGQPIGEGALIELKNPAGALSLSLLARLGGGRTATVDGKTVRVITPLSPIGEALLGSSQGDVIEVEQSSGIHEYEIIHVG